MKGDNAKRLVRMILREQQQRRKRDMNPDQSDEQKEALAEGQLSHVSSTQNLVASELEE